MIVHKCVALPVLAAVGGIPPHCSTPMVMRTNTCALVWGFARWPARDSLLANVCCCQPQLLVVCAALKHSHGFARRLLLAAKTGEVTCVWHTEALALFRLALCTLTSSLGRCITCARLTSLLLNAV